MRTQITFALILAVLEPFADPAAAQDLPPIVQTMFMVKVDFEKIHALLIDTCKAKYPKSAPSLTKSLSAWEAENRSAQIELKKIARQRFWRPNEGDDEDQRKLTDSFGKAMINIPDNELRSACEGAYANTTLKAPELNFAAVLRMFQELDASK